jgi:hypothetical protein
VLLYHEVPKASYRDYSTAPSTARTFRTYIGVGDGKNIHVESSAKYLGSVLHSNSKDDADVTARVKKATGACASLKQHCLFKRKDVYNSLVLSISRPRSILLFGCKSWSLTQRLRDKLQTFHRGCVRDMCRLNMNVARAAVPHHGTGIGEVAGHLLLPDLPGTTETSVAWVCATHALAGTVCLVNF